MKATKAQIIEWLERLYRAGSKTYWYAQYDSVEAAIAAMKKDIKGMSVAEARECAAGFGMY